MRFQFMLVPPALVLAASPALGVDMMTLEAAQAQLYPGASFTAHDFTLTASQVEQLKREYAVPLMRPAVKVWRASTGGWLFLDQVYGLQDIVTYMAAIDDSGKVTGVEVLVCAEGFCDVAEAAWEAEFIGAKHKVGDLPKDVSNISGSTLSCVHIAEGVKKLLAIHALFMPKTAK
jgi:hypothetical protein